MRPLSTIPARVSALLMVAVAPIFVLAVLIADRNAEFAADRAAAPLVAALARWQAVHRNAVSEAERLLTALAMTPAVQSGNEAQCSAALTRVLALSEGPYSGLFVQDVRGRVWCGAGSGAAQASGIATIGHPAAHPAVLPVAVALVGPDGHMPLGTLVAAIDEASLLGLPDSGSAAGFDAWLVPQAGEPVALPRTGDVPSPGALPGAGDMARLTSLPGRSVQGESQNGSRFHYALGDVGSGTRLLLATPIAGAWSEGERVFARHLAELALLLLAGLAIVALGADIAVGRPLKQVAKGVARWRAGGRFDPGPLTGAPSEIMALAGSFGEATAALSKREQQLRDATAQQELLMQEIHHRVKNNLQVVASLLNLQASRIRQPEARAEFHAARDRIRALATLHRHLYAHGELHTINMRGFLNELCEQLLNAMGETPAGGRIALTIEASELQISSDQAVPMALLVTEAVSNAVKYAFPGGRSGHIAVRLAIGRDTEGQERARLTIDDDGVGIPAGRSETESGVRDGLGLRLIRGFARQLGSELEMTEDQGTHYAVNIVLSRQRVADGPLVSGAGLEAEAA